MRKSSGTDAVSTPFRDLSMLFAELPAQRVHQGTRSVPFLVPLGGHISRRKRDKAPHHIHVPTPRLSSWPLVHEPLQRGRPETPQVPRGCAWGGPSAQSNALCHVWGMAPRRGNHPKHFPQFAGIPLLRDGGCCLLSIPEGRAKGGFLESVLIAAPALLQTSPVQAEPRTSGETGPRSTTSLLLAALPNIAIPI